MVSFLFRFFLLCFSFCFASEVTGGKKEDLLFIAQKIKSIDEKLERLLQQCGNAKASSEGRSVHESKEGSSAEVSHPVRKPTFEQQWHDRTTKRHGGTVKEMDLPEPSEEEESYRHALTLIKQSKKREAEAQLNGFVERFPESSLLDDVYYLLGDLYFSEKNYKPASLNFLKSYKNNKRGSKTSLAMIKAVRSLRLLKEYGHACSMLRKVLKEFPGDAKIKVQLEQEKEALSVHCEN